MRIYEDLKEKLAKKTPNHQVLTRISEDFYDFLRRPCDRHQLLIHAISGLLFWFIFFIGSKYISTNRDFCGLVYYSIQLCSIIAVIAQVTSWLCILATFVVLISFRQFLKPHREPSIAFGIIRINWGLLLFIMIVQMGLLICIRQSDTSGDLEQKRKLAQEVCNERLNLVIVIVFMSAFIVYLLMTLHSPSSRETSNATSQLFLPQNPDELMCQLKMNLNRFSQFQANSISNRNSVYGVNSINSYYISKDEKPVSFNPTSRLSKSFSTASQPTTSQPATVYEDLPSKITKPPKSSLRKFLSFKV